MTPSTQAPRCRRLSALQYRRPNNISAGSALIVFGGGLFAFRLATLDYPRGIVARESS